VPDPYLRPQTSATNRLARALWGIVNVLLFRPSPRPAHAWRRWLLRCFGARLGANCRIYPRCEIWAPWNLVCADTVAIADGAIIYNPSQVTLGSHATVSQQAYLCGASHDLERDDFPTISAPIDIGAYCWVCARAAVLPGVNMAEGSVLALGAVATCDLDAWQVYAGIPARHLRARGGRPARAEQAP
jgi:putative colanic acid biosynthesis acetyltransferase WcaF